MRYLGYIMWLCMIIGLVLLGIYGSRFHLYIAMRVMILGIFALGYNLLFGLTGLLSFGHGAFYATGAYGLGLFLLHINSNPFLGILVGIGVTVLFAMVIGFFCIRHTEIYFAMLTLAFGMMVFSLIWNLRDITGGDDGLIGIMRNPLDFGLFSIPINSPGQFYFLVLFFFLLSVFVQSSPPKSIPTQIHPISNIS